MDRSLRRYGGGLRRSIVNVIATSPVAQDRAHRDDMRVIVVLRLHPDFVTTATSWAAPDSAHNAG